MISYLELWHRQLHGIEPLPEGVWQSVPGIDRVGRNVMGVPWNDGPIVPHHLRGPPMYQGVDQNFVGVPFGRRGVLLVVTLSPSSLLSLVEALLMIVKVMQVLKVVHPELVCLLDRSGRIWIGSDFSFQTSVSFEFDIGIWKKKAKSL